MNDMKQLKIWLFYSYQLDKISLIPMIKNLTVRLNDLGYSVQLQEWNKNLSASENIKRMKEVDLGIFLHYNTFKIPFGYIGKGIFGTVEEFKEANIPVLVSHHKNSDDIIGTFYASINTEEIEEQKNKNFQSRFASMTYKHKLFNDNQIIDLLNSKTPNNLILTKRLIL